MEENKEFNSGFSGAIGIQERIDILQTQINYLNIDLLKINQEIGKYNYEIKFNCICTLFGGVHVKCSKTEKKQIEDARVLISDFMRDNQIFEMNKNKTSMYSKGDLQKLFYKEHWKFLDKGLFDFHMLVNFYLEKYYPSPTRENLDNFKEKK